MAEKAVVSKKYRYILIVIGSCLLYTITYFTSTAVSLFYNPICNELGFNLTALKAYYTIAMFIGLFSCPFLMKSLFPKLGARKTVLILGTIGGVAYFCIGMCSRLWQWYVLGGIIGLTLSTVIGTIAQILINMWFLDKTGLFLGIGSAMTGVVGIAFSSPLGKIVSDNWRNGYFAVGIFILAVIWISGLLCIRNSPKDCQMQPYGLEKYMEKQQDSVSQKNVLRGLKLKSAIKSVPFWIFFAGNVIFGFLLAFTQSSVGFFMEQGFDLAQAAGFLGWLSGSLIFWKLVLGWMADKLGGKWAFIIALAITFFGFALQIFMGASNVMVPYIFIVCYGCGISTVSVLNTVCIKEMFGVLDLQGILPVLGIACGVSNAVCVMLWDVLYGITNSYSGCAWIAAISAAVFAASILLAFSATKSEKFKSMIEETEA